MRKLLALVVLVLASVSACGDEGSPTVASAPPARATSDGGSPAATDDAITAGGECHDATEVEGQADLEMQDNAFAPECLLISESQGLRMHNEGDNEHNFTVEGFGLDVDVSPGDENNTEATGLEPGSYTFFCKYHRSSDDMEGKLLVKRA